MRGASRAGGRSIFGCGARFLDQHVPRLKQELEAHNGFHRSPLVPRCLKILKYIFPCAVWTAQCRLSNELNRFGCAVQYNRRARADTQLWINWKVRHGSLTHQLPPEFHTPLNRCLLRVVTEKVSLE